MGRLYERNRDLSRPVERIELTVEPEEEGRLDQFLAARLRWRSRTGARRLIEDGSATIGGEKRKPSSRVRAGDVVVIVVERQDQGPEPEPPPVEILFEDDAFLALNKASGTVVHPVGAHQRGTLLQELHRRYAGSEMLPKLAHRLDQFTSGVLLVAKKPGVRTAFSDMLEAGRVTKVYEALLLGRVEWDEREVHAAIAPVADSRILMQVDEEAGKAAHSQFSVVERFPFATHAEVRIFTGRTHQIRVHAAHLGHPLIGDHLYGDGLSVGAYERFALHARRTSFPHPVTGEETTIEAPLPAAFFDAIEILRTAADG
ncbi:MAG: RluA family pseudouridine synthase [Planctomycetota bacterium]|jgi:23S rRNA pseudouridine1911/1915/1917 synthase